MQQRFLWIAAIGMIAVLSACGGGGGLSPFSPAAVSGPSSTATPTLAPSPTATPTPQSTIIIGTPTFPIGGSGSCASSVVFDAAGQQAIMTLAELGYTGSFSVSSSDQSVVTAAVSGNTLTITAVNSGAATVKVSDQNGATSPCAISVTITGGTVQ